jgi:hypothetical protein
MEKIQTQKLTKNIDRQINRQKDKQIERLTLLNIESKLWTEYKHRY